MMVLEVMQELTAEAVEESAEPLLFRGGLDVRNFVQRYDDWGNPVKGNLHCATPPSTRRISGATWT